MLMYDYLSHEQPFLVFILSGVFYLVAAYFTGFLENRFCKAKQKNNKYVILMMSKWKISLNDRM